MGSLKLKVLFVVSTEGPRGGRGGRESHGSSPGLDRGGWALVLPGPSPAGCPLEGL